MQKERRGGMERRSMKVVGLLWGDRFMMCGTAVVDFGGLVNEVRGGSGG